MQLLDQIKKNYPEYKIYSNDEEIILIYTSDVIIIPAKLIHELLYLFHISYEKINMGITKATISLSNEFSIVIKILLK